MNKPLADAIAWAESRIASVEAFRDELPNTTESIVAHLRTLLAAARAGAVPRFPTQAMLDAVDPFPEHLRKEHPDPNDPWLNNMLAATLADQSVARDKWITMYDASPINALHETED